MRALAVTAVAVVACHAHPAPLVLPPAGVTISVYDTESIVDDRRWVVVNGPTLALDHIDPAASLASLTIDSDLHVGACRREPAAASVVRCDVIGSPGRHFVRLVYATSALHYRAEHDVTLSGARATIVSRFTIETPAWGGRVALTLFDGTPGGDHAPRELAHAGVSLDGSTFVVAAAPRDAAATLQWIYDGALLGDLSPSDAAWGRDSQPVVWVWLELADVALAPGPVRVHVDGREAGVAADARRGDQAVLQLPLWKDPELRGSRTRFVDLGTGAELAERVVLGVANTGKAPREVWMEEHLRPARRHRIEHAWPARPSVTDDVVRTRLVVPAGATERTGFTIAYDY